MNTKERQAGFKKELYALLEKYNAELEVVDRYDGATLEVNFLATYDPGAPECCGGFSLINLGFYIFAESNATDDRAVAAPVNQLVGQFPEDK